MISARTKWVIEVWTLELWISRSLFDLDLLIIFVRYPVKCEKRTEAKIFLPNERPKKVGIYKIKRSSPDSLKNSFHCGFRDRGIVIMGPVSNTPSSGKSLRKWIWTTLCCFPREVVWVSAKETSLEIRFSSLQSINQSIIFYYCYYIIIYHCYYIIIHYSIDHY